MPDALLQLLKEDGQARQEAFIACHHGLAKLDLIAPSLAPTARRLYEVCSETHSITDKSFWTATRELAYEAFLEAARKELEIKPPSNP